MVEQFAFRRDESKFEIFVTFPALPEDRFFLPKFGSDILMKGLKLAEDDDWGWRVITKPTVKKLTGKKLVGNSTVLHLWGYHFGTKIPFKSLKKHVPFETELLEISDGEPLVIRQTHTGK